jgi:hypothetical protein
LLFFTTPRLLTAVAAALAPHSYTRTLPVVELRGYIEARVVDPVDPMRHPGRAEYFFRTVDGRRYRLDLGGAKFYLCGHFTSYVGTGKLVVVKGFLRPDLVLPYRYHGDYVLFATEVRDPHCR